MKKEISVKKTKARAFRKDYLVTGIGKRTIHVWCDAEGFNYTEHELYYTILEVAKKACSLGWKHVKFKTPYWENHSCNYLNVLIKNPAGHEIILGNLEEISNTNHYLNDVYLTPAGFWIK